MIFESRLGDAQRLGLGLGDHHVPVDPDGDPAGKFRLRHLAALPRRASASLNVSMFDLASAIDPSVAKCRPRSPAQVEPTVFDEPYQIGGCGRCRVGIAIGTSRRK